MHFSGFKIRNFKGIESADLALEPQGARVFTLIGLNESGKTTILEAISKLIPNNEKTEELYGNKGQIQKPDSFVPKSLKSNFSGEITIATTLVISEEERQDAVREVDKMFDCKIEIDSIPLRIGIERHFNYKNSSYTGTGSRWTVQLQGRRKGQKKPRVIEPNEDIWQGLIELIRSKAPQIVYYPTFLFEFPELIQLNPSGPETAVNAMYRQILEDVAAMLKNPLDVKTNIVDKILKKETAAEKVIGSFWGSRQEEISASLNQMSAHITNTVFKEWAKIFGVDLRGREIILSYVLDESDPIKPVVSLRFNLKDGPSVYNISERSLGFRWFFSFLLFTLYRSKSKRQRSILFLLDEPASNLHSKAQTQLLESFPKIAEGENAIIYSTHSHYLINPNWLEQSYVVSNSAIDYETAEGESEDFVRDNPTRISLQKYRAFVGQNPDRVTYFQPVLDKLDYAPSRLDLLTPSVFVEGKGDYAIIEYVRKVVLNEPVSFAIVPTRGAGGLHELIGMFLGWGVEFGICLDGDKAGMLAQKSYREEWGMPNGRVITYRDATGLTGDVRAEDLLMATDIERIKSHFSIQKAPTKSEIRLYFSELLAEKKLTTVSPELKSRVKLILAAMSETLKANY